jgi:hypothetical protein
MYAGMPLRKRRNDDGFYIEVNNKDWASSRAQREPTTSNKKRKGIVRKHSVDLASCHHKHYVFASAYATGCW